MKIKWVFIFFIVFIIAASISYSYQTNSSNYKLFPLVVSSGGDITNSSTYKTYTATGIISGVINSSTYKNLLGFFYTWLLANGQACTAANQCEGGYCCSNVCRSSACPTQGEEAAPSGGGGGGAVASSGGGGIGIGGVGVLDSAADIWSTVDSGSSIEFKVDKEAIAVTNIFIGDIKSELGNVELGVESLAQSPISIEPSSIVYQYFRVNTKNIKEDDAESFKISFRVTESWLSENSLGSGDVALYRFTERWEELTTKATGTDSLYVNYEADTPGFSLFSIGLKGGVPFTVSPDTIKVKLKVGESSTQILRIKSIAAESLSISLFMEGINEFLSLSEKNFDLKTDESAQVTLNFIGKKVGGFTGQIKAKAGGIEKSIPIIIEVVSEKVLFDVKLDIPTAYAVVEPGGTLKSQITLLNVGAPEKADVLVTYFIKDLRSKIIYEENGMIAVENQVSFAKSFKIPEKLEPGRYVAIIEVRYADSFAVSSQLFEVEEKKSVVEQIVSRNTAVILVLIFILAGFVIIMLFKPVPKRKSR